MNKIILKGRLTANPEMRKTQSDIAVCNFTIAVNRRFDRDKTDFVTCEAWRQTAEFVSKYFTKGKEIAVCGELHIDKWDKDGETKYITKVSVDEVEFCGSKNDNIENKARLETSETINIEDVIDDDDLPFA